MLLTLEQRLEVYKKVDEMIDAGNAHFGTDCNVPNTIFTKRGTCGGTANYSKMELNFNAALMLDNWDEYMNQIIIHECAHIIKTHIYGYGKGTNSSHGSNWKRVMRALGVEPDRCHDMDTSKVKQFKSPLKKFIYVCTCGCNKEVILSAVRHNRMARRTHNYQMHRGNDIALKESLGSMTYKQAHDRKMPGFIKEAAAQKKAATKNKAPRAGTVIARALTAYRDMLEVHPLANRADLVTAIEAALDVTPKRAGQIYQDCKKREAA